MNQESLTQYTDSWAKQALGVAFFSWASHKGEPVTPEELSGCLQLRWGFIGQCIKLMIEIDKEKANGDYWLSGYNLHGDDPFTLLLRHYRSITPEEANLIEEIIRNYFPCISSTRCHVCGSVITVQKMDEDWFCQTCLVAISRLTVRPGYVYLFGSSETGYYKIGRSVAPKSRMKVYQAALLPFKVEMLHIIPADDMVRAERAIHYRYEKQKTNGEWFKLPPQELAWILNIKAYKAGEWVFS